MSAHYEIVPFAGGIARRRTLEDQRRHGRSHRRALGRSSACLPASVIRTRVTSIARSPAITRSVVTLASLALISSTNRSLLKPCASKIAAVQPSGDAASNSSARRRSALRRGPSAISASIGCKLCLRDRRVEPGIRRRAQYAAGGGGGGFGGLGGGCFGGLGGSMGQPTFNSHDHLVGAGEHDTSNQKADMRTRANPFTKAFPAI